LKISIAEILERVFAHPSVHESVNLGRTYTLIRYIDNRLVGEVNFSRVLFTGKHPMNRSLEEARLLDHTGKRTNGLAFHPDISQAISHAILELVERHHACRLWYDENIRIIPISAQSELGLGYLLNRYTILNEPILPFVCSIISHPDKSFFVCGTSMRLNMSDAVKKADNEALSTIENFFQDSGGLANNRVTEARFNELIGAEAERKLKHFSSKLSEPIDLIFSKIQMNLDELLTASFQYPEKVFYAPLWECASGWVVRALADEALDKRQLRHQFTQSNIPSDPFC
jgi:hypothetical protein